MTIAIADMDEDFGGSTEKKIEKLKASADLYAAIHPSQ